MAQTMLYVNEHLHDQLYDGAVDPGWIRSFAPGDYLVVTTANGDLVTISGHPAERGTFELFVAAFGLDELADVRAIRHSRRRGWRTSPSCASASLQRQPASPTPRRWRSGSAQHGLAAGKVRDARELAESAWASDRRGDRRRLRPRRRDDPHPQPAVALRRRAGEITGEPRYRGEDNRAVLAELLGYDDGRIDELEASGVCRAASRPLSPSARPTVVLGLSHRARSR